MSRKLEQDFRPKEAKPSIVNQQCVVYYFSCDLCVAEHKYSAFGKHLTEAHSGSDLLNESRFKILKKCQSKFDCLIFEILFIKRLKPNLNVQTDSIRAKLFV